MIGAGASGTLLASHLLRAGGARVLLVERAERVGRGVAYGTDFPGHLLNVPAASMSGLPDDPGHFLRYARRHFDPSAEPTTFVPRRVYGDYLEALLAASREVAAPGSPLMRRHGEVVDVAAASGARAWSLRFADGSRVGADRVVLALGNLPPRDPVLASGGWPDDPSRYIRDPWRAGALEGRARGPVLLVGTGLTMVDVALQLQAQTPGQQIVALSRGGLFPHAHRTGGAAPSHGVPVPDPSPSLTALLRFVRTAAVVAEVGGGDWRDAVNALRPITQDLWRALPRHEQRRFVERLARFWDIHRHRLPPEAAAAVAALRESGRLTFASGRIRSVAAAGDGAAVTVQERGDGGSRILRVASVVNCTGPTGDVREGGSRLLEALCASGTVRPHPLALGLDTCGDGAVRDARGRESETLFALGPLRRGDLWESTAVPEIRAQARALAQHLTQPRALARSRAPSYSP
ncbi:MAG: hypothetical protein QOE87_2286 [Gaiellales bacterium]|nr:hypothetical protein [Gaiellales bacterium]